MACREHDRPDDCDDNHDHAGDDVLAVTEASIPRAVHEVRVVLGDINDEWRVQTPFGFLCRSFYHEPILFGSNRL